MHNQKNCLLPKVTGMEIFVLVRTYLNRAKSSLDEIDETDMSEELVPSPIVTIIIPDE